MEKNEYYKRVSAVLEVKQKHILVCDRIRKYKIFWIFKRIIFKRNKWKKWKTLKQFDLYEDKDKKVSNYLRGMQQKLAIIISLINNPDVLFLDEPTLGLDVESKHKMMEILEEISNKNNRFDNSSTRCCR